MTSIARGLCLTILIGAGLLIPFESANSATDLTRLRALHFTGNWGGNISGIRTSVSSILSSAKSILAASVQTSVNRSSFVDSSGTTITNDTAQVRLTGVTLGSTTTLSQAGFWIGRNTSTQQAFLQFRPSLDSSLTGVSGFAGDITFSIAADGSTIDTQQLSLASRTANDYVIAVLANAAALIQTGAFSLQAPATFDKTSIVQILQTVAANLRAQQDAYFQFLTTENVEWIGISVAIFNGPLSDPTVRVKYRPQGDTSFDVFTFDDADLQNFITRAKQLGFKIYLTLAFEPSGLNLPPSPTDPTCNTDQFNVNRAFFGDPSIITSDPNEACINSGYWWWNPSHPSYARNVAQFWSTYIQVAVKYATMCQQLGIDIFSLGTETGRLFRTRTSTTWPKHFRNELSQMVAAVRSVYSGQLTYNQEYSIFAHPEWFDGGAGSQYLFQDLALDIVGISAYFELANPPVTRVLTVSELESAWTGVFQNYLAPLQAANPGKPIIFTEFGSTDDVGAPADAASRANEFAPEPQRNANGVTDGMLQQQNIFQAFFNVNDRYGGLVRGAFIWGNEVMTNNSRLCSTIGYNIYCKPSAQTVATVYGQWLYRDTERVFAWAEAMFPQYFPNRPTTQTALGYTFRFYPATSNYLAVKDARVIVHNGTTWNFLDVGSLRTYLDSAASQGF